MGGVPEDSGMPSSMRRAPDGTALPAEQNIEIKSAAEAGSPDTEVTSTEVAPAGTAPPSQPELNLTNEPVRPWVANVRSLHETRDKHEFWLGPLRIVVYSAEHAEDTSFQAAGTSMLRFTYGGLSTGVVTAGVSELLADPSGTDLLYLGLGSGSGIILLGVALNGYRIMRDRRH